MEKQTLHHYFDEAKLQLIQDNPDQARDYADMIIHCVAQKRGEGMDVMEQMEGVTLRLWLERAWMFLEKNNLLL